MIEMLQQASSYAADVDGLVILVAVLSGFWFFIAQAVFFGLIFRYRAKPGKKSKYVTGREKHLNRWISFPHGLVLVCDIFIILGSVNVWYNIKQQLPEADRVGRITGQQWAWTFQHPGSDGELDTGDDIYAVDELHVEVDKTYHFILEARDVLHSFSVPVFRLKQDALPGRSITGWFRPTLTGEFDVQCAEICGIGHGLMAARIFITEEAGHAAWGTPNTLNP